jgi:hypothetical protein
MTIAMRPDFMFAHPSWLSGAGRVIDIGGQLDDYNISQSEEEADAKAWFSDWRIVGETIGQAMRALRVEAEGKASK